MRVRLLGVPRCRFWSLRHWCCLLLGITSQLPCFPPCPLSALLRSLCTPANTRLITPLSIGPRFTPKGREVLSSLCCLSISFPYIGLYNLLSILFFSLQANLKPWRLYVLDIVVTCCALIKLSMLDVPVFTLKLVCFVVLFITHSFMEVHSRHVWKCAWAPHDGYASTCSDVCARGKKRNWGKISSLPFAALWGLLFQRVPRLTIFILSFLPLREKRYNPQLIYK